MITPVAPRRFGRWQKIIAGLFWLLLVGGYGWYAWRNNLGPRETAARLIEILQGGFGVLIYLGVNLLRPLVLFPATVLTVAGGIVFGPLLGLLYAVIGANASALLAYWIGRFFGGDTLPTAESSDEQAGLIGRYVKRLRANSFTTIMTLRFLFVPYDLVNYLAGILKIDWRSFIIATALGSLPGTLTFVLLGASLRGGIETAEFTLQPVTFAASAAIFAISIAISRYLKHREARRDQEPPSSTPPGSA